MIKVSSIKFFSMADATKRRLQTLAVVAHCAIVVVCAPLAFFILPYIICCTSYWWAGLAYLCYMLVDRRAATRGGKPSDWVRRWASWTYTRDYFPMKLVKTAELDPSKNYLLCAFPHGIFSIGIALNFATEANDVSQLYPGMTHHMMTVGAIVYPPFVRELTMRLGMSLCSRESLDYLLDSAHGTGRTVVVVVGGAAAMPRSSPGTPRIFLNKRKGFVKIALEHGVSLVPVFAFGENDLYHQVIFPDGSWGRWVQDMCRKVIRLYPLFIYGQGFFENSYGLIPRRKPVTTVVGKPMPAKHIPEPTQEQIDDLHSRFTQQLVALFEEHKHHYLENPENTHLVIY